MTYIPIGAVQTAPRMVTRASLPPLSGNLAQLRAALADKRLMVSRLEAGWVAAAEAAIARHLPKHVRLDDRGTWDGPTYRRYLAQAEKIEPEFKPRIRRLLSEIDSLERLLSPSQAVFTRNAA